MGFFGLFGGNKAPTPAAIKKYAERVANKRLQAPDRWEAIRALAGMKTAESVAALLIRFTFYVEPSITDQEEKDAAFEAVIDAGDVSVAPIKTFMAKSESIAWPLKMLDRLLSPEQVNSELLELLTKMGVEYERDPQRKSQVLSALGERKDARIVEAVERFLADFDESSRFAAAGAILAQDNAEAGKGALLGQFEKEDSVRVRVRILEGFVERGWTLGDRADALRAKLPAGFAIDPKGGLHKR